MTKADRCSSLSNGKDHCMQIQMHRNRRTKYGSLLSYAWLHMHGLFAYRKVNKEMFTKCEWMVLSLSSLFARWHRRNWNSFPFLYIRCLDASIESVFVWSIWSDARIEQSAVFTKLRHSTPYNSCECVTQSSVDSGFHSIENHNVFAWFMSTAVSSSVPFLSSPSSSLCIFHWLQTLYFPDYWGHSTARFIDVLLMLENDLNWSRHFLVRTGPELMWSPLISYINKVHNFHDFVNKITFAWVDMMFTDLFTKVQWPRNANEHYTRNNIKGNFKEHSKIWDH